MHVAPDVLDSSELCDLFTQIAKKSAGLHGFAGVRSPHLADRERFLDDEFDLAHLG